MTTEVEVQSAFFNRRVSIIMDDEEVKQERDTCYRVVLAPDTSVVPDADPGEWKVGEVITNLGLDIWAVFHGYQVIQLVSQRPAFTGQTTYLE